MIEFLVFQVSLPTMLEMVSLLLVISALMLSMRQLLFSKKRSLESISASAKVLSKRNKALLLLLNIMVLLGLLGLILQPKILTSQQQKIRLFTDGSYSSEAQKFTKRSAVVANYGFFQSLSPSSLQSKLTDMHVDEVEELITPQQLVIKYPLIDEIEVMGDGLAQQHWQQFDNIKINYQAPSKLTGLVKVEWQKQLNLGEFLHINGQLQADTNQIYTLQLIDPANQVIDERKLLAGEYFSFAAQPKLAGLFLYKLRLALKDVIVTEEISVQVTELAQVKLLVIQSAPSFETKQLQNWSAEFGAKFLMLTQVSRDRWISRKTNIAADISTKISDRLFDQFDLLIIDGRALLELTESQKQQLISSLEDGLGILVIADQNLIASLGSSQNVLNDLLQFQLVVQNEIDQAIVSWHDNSDGTTGLNEQLTPVANIKIVNVAENSANEVLVESEFKQPLVVARSALLGQIGVTLISQTHQWVTSGQKNIYSHYWQTLIKRLSRKGESEVFIPVNKRELVWQDHRTQLCFTTNSANPEASVLSLTNQSEEQLILNQSTSQQGQYCGYFWPSQSGWYQIQANLQQNNTLQTSAFYVQSKKNWLAELQSQKIQATLAKQSSFKPSTKSSKKQNYLPVNNWIFWWLLILGMSGIWGLEKKYKFSL